MERWKTMRDKPLPMEMAKWMHLGSLKFNPSRKGEDQWTSECPVCRDDGHEQSSGPPDRFQMFGPGSGNYGSARGWCRRCGHFEWAEDKKNDYKPDPVRTALATKLRRQYALDERERLRQKIAWLQKQTFWLEWHENMGEKGRELWDREGIHRDFIEVHKLGYRPDYHCGDKDIPAMTIPYFMGDKVQTIQYRLTEPNEGGKYRFLKGTSPTWFKPWPIPLESIILVVEGAKKAMVTFHQAGNVRYRGKPVSILATPSKLVPHRMMKALKKRDPELVIWLLDPDAYRSDSGKATGSAIERNVTAFGPDRSLIVEPIDKIDDMFLRYDLDATAFQAMINQSSPLFTR